MTVRYKLIILVMCSSSYKYKKLENAIKKTWATNVSSDVKIIFYTDNQRKLFKSRKPIFKDPNLILPCKDGYFECTEKTLQAFQYITSNYEFEYIFRTNLGSYINLDKILFFLMDKPTTKFYSGIIGQTEYEGTSILFASGSGFFLSQDLVKFTVTNRTDFNNELIDDVALGAFMHNNNIPLDTHAKRLSYTDDTREYQIGKETVDYLDYSLLYHVRLRSANRAIDINRMRALFNSNF
jgi:hypothetical protein